VTSRKIELIDEQKAPFTAVIPFFDYFNHMDSTQDKWTWGYRTVFHTEALKNFKKGEQVYQFYGEYPNSKFLEQYGFIIEPNSFDSVLVETAYLGVDPDDPLISQKKKLIEPYRKKGNSLKILVNGVSQHLMEAASILMAEETDFDSTGKLKQRLSFGAELNVARWYQAVCNHKLEQFANSLEEDEALVQSPQFETMSNRLQMAIKVRMNEKKILHEVLEAFAAKEQRMIRAAQKVSGNKEQHEDL